MTQDKSNLKKYKHRTIEDIISIAQAILVFSIGITFFQKANIIAGGTSGIALIISHILGYKLGTVFFAINLPFYFIALFRLGFRFFIKTIITVSLSSLLINYLPSFISVEITNRFMGAVFAGLFCGIGILILLRHKSSIGGFTILVTFIQDRFNINGGNILLIIDSLLMTFSLYIFNVETVLYSFVAILMVNIILIFNNKPGRYSAIR